MTDQPIPDRSDDLTTPPKLNQGDAPIATGTGDPATTDAGPISRQATSDDASGDDSTSTGDAPRPSPDI